MKKIIVWECDHCGKILKTKSLIAKHEPNCFRNPESKSCITCESLTLKDFYNGKPLTEKEEKILHFQVDGTYHIEKGDMEVDLNDLNEEYQYLYDSETKNFCKSLKCELVKLRTHCFKHTEKSKNNV